MGLWFRILFSVIVALHNAADLITAASTGHRLTPVGTILTPDFVDAVQQIVDNGTIPGLTLAIVNKTRPAELGAWGIKAEDEAFLSTSLGILIDDFAHGRNITPLPAGLSALAWKTKLADLLPDARSLMDPWASQKANLIDILTHVHDLSYKLNSCMYMVGSYVVSALSRMRYADFVSSRIFKPLGMGSWTYSTDAAIRTGRFTGTWTSFGRAIVDLMAGPGGVITSVEELVPWVRTLMNNGFDLDNNGTIIPPTEFDVIRSAHSILDPNVTAPFSTKVYGLGWIRVSYGGHDVTFIAVSLSDGIAVVGLANASAKQSTILDIIFKALEKAVSLTVSPSPSSPLARRTISPAKRPSPNSVTAADDAVTTPSDLDFAGTYYNAGYGTSVLCSTQSVLNDFRSVDKSLSPNSTDVFFSLKTPWSTHIRLTHITSRQYLASAGSIYPEGYGRNSTPFATLDPISFATFVVENYRVRSRR
ncbi:beta-lactamase/transpeptidase-like protein [Russula earlei]|uniref:Beta-lactamase/transpeptidase-like protein n=1 Tax=Russula earlei TaxID=71964 RepID=A0ACC0TX42_9AGAM|nr:beta-lactamase/transpeptidase-like protein [Russula earlei]